MKKSVLSILALSLVLLSASGIGHALPSGKSTMTIGYTDKDFAFKKFYNSPSLMILATANVSSEDQSVTVVGDTLNGSTEVTKTNVNGKKIAILNHQTTFTLAPGQATAPFPSIWVKGATANTDAGTGTFSDPLKFFTGTTEANKFYQTALTVMAPYYEVPDYQWTVYVFADKDILSQADGGTTGKVLDPRVSTVIWYAWTGDSAGIPKKMWGYRNPGAASASLYNTLPIISSSATEAQRKAFLTGTAGASLPETAAGYPAIADAPEASIPADGQIYYNSTRNSSLPNGFTISGRSQAGLVYASPTLAPSHRTEYLHIQFVAINRSNMSIAPGTKSCTINFYHRTAN